MIASEKMKSVLIAVGFITCAAPLIATAEDDGHLQEVQPTQTAQPFTVIEDVIEPRYAADIRYTSYGVPHIKADNYEGLGYGLAWAFAKENACLGSELFLTLRGERAQYLGGEELFIDAFAGQFGQTVSNIESDFYHKYVYRDRAAFQKRGAGPEVRGLVEGYAAGFNAFLRDHADDIQGPCKGEAWVQPITEDDVYRRLAHSQMLGGGGIFVKSIAEAMVPVADDSVEEQAKTYPQPKSARAHRLAQSNMPQQGLAQFGSNAVAFGRDLTPTGEPMMFANPHFPWFGSERLYQAHLTIPGVYDVMGASLYGVPVTQIGFTRTVSWSLTWSTDARFLIRELTLNKENSAEYFIDGEPHTMDETPITVSILNADGSFTTETRLAYATQFGPLIAGEFFPGGRTKAFAFTDLNYENNRGTETYFRFGLAQSAADFDAAQDALVGLPYSNVIAVDAAGDAYFSNKSIAANITDEQIDACVNGMRANFFKDSFAVLLLDGSTSDCSPATSGAAPQSGILSADEKPSLIRSDYTIQTNDSHWIVNADPASFQEGYGFVVGQEQTVRGDRLHTGIALIEDRQAGADGLAGTDMTPAHMRDLFYRGRLRYAELLKDGLVEDCKRHSTMWIAWSLNWVDVSEACEALEAWDASESADSRGGHIFRQFYQNMTDPYGKLDASLWKVAFDPEAPLTTPRDYRATRKSRSAFAKAVKALKEEGLPLDAALGDIQFTTIDGERVPLSGGAGFHSLSPTRVPGVGYTDPIIFGDSYIQAVALTPTGPQGLMVNAYGQSSEATSQHATDQTLLYSSGDWVEIRFTDAEIEADPNYTLVSIAE